MRLVVDTGRPIAHVAAEIGVGEQLLGRWVATKRVRPPIVARCSMTMKLKSWNVADTFCSTEDKRKSLQRHCLVPDQ